MKISRGRFDELVSSYLDGEATPAEIELLAKCVRDDPRMADIFHKTCRLHAAMCSIYGKKAVFAPLDGVSSPFFAAKKTSRVRAALEWSAVAALMIVCAALMKLAVDTMPAHDEKIAKSVLPSEDGAVVSEKIVTENGTVFSVIRIKSNAPTGIAAFE